MDKGTYTAMITPFKNGEVDYEGLIENIHDQLEARVEGLLFLGTTAESPTLSALEQKKIIEIGVREVNQRALVLVGTGTNCTRRTIEKTKLAQNLGADVALVVSPYYNKPSQRGLYAHFEALSKESSMPLLAYNHLGRTGVQIEIDTLLKIAELPSVIGVKETSQNFDFLKQLHEAVLSHNPHFSIFSGCDENTKEMIAMGSSGVISVISNLVPKEMKALVEASLCADEKRANQLQRELAPFMELACLETNPVPIKAAMDFIGKPAGKPRLPLCPLSQENSDALQTFLNQWNLLLCKR